MKLKSLLRLTAALFVIVSLFSTPLLAMGASTHAAVAKKGEKNFKQGLKHEVAEQWDKAAEEFAFALAADPGNTEYRLHYARALFNASQMMMKRGRALSEQKDYTGAYNAFRQAYGYDPTNELAKAEMERMLRLQQGVEDENTRNQPKDSPTTNPTGVKLIPTQYPSNAAPATVPQDIPPSLEPLRDIKYTKVDLKSVIKDLAQSLDLNVLFDKDTFRQGAQQDFTIELKNVTTAQALDYIFLQEGLFFQRVGKRAILVASQNRRQNFQQLVLRTFYLANAKPEDVQRVLQQALPPQPGRAPLQPIVDKDTNSLTVRDTSENIKIIAQLIKALDKDRAEVVMDVNIYEVSKNDLLQIGNQIGTEASLGNLGGSTSSVVGFGNAGDIFGQVTNTAGQVTGLLPRTLATGFLIPAAQLTAFQSKDNTKLLASTQIHAFNGEESQARIGQRVPVQTAQLLGFNNNTGGNAGGVNNGNNNAATVFNYEQVGLTLKFTPQVFPNQDVQVKMSIESKDVATGGTTPTFTERAIQGTARIQNNRTLMLASVAQDTQSNGRAGLPLLGLIPVLGRLFTAPKKSNRQVDIVIAVTPRVLRAPTILPEDEQERETGSVASPTNSSLATLIQREDAEDRLIAARRLPNVAVVQLQDQKPEDAAPGYVAATEKPNAAMSTVTAPTTDAPQITPKPIDASAVKTLNIAPTAEKLDDAEAAPNMSAMPAPAPSAAELKIEPLGELKAGEKRRVAVMVNSPVALRFGVLSLAFDPAKIKINRVIYGEVFGAELAGKDAPPFAAAAGTLMATLPTRGANLAQGAGVLAYLEIEVIADGDAALKISETSNLIGVGGESLSLKR